MDSENRINTGGGGLVGGKLETGWGDSAGNTVNKNRTGNNLEGGITFNINQPSSQPEPDEREQYRGRLMPSVEQELRAGIQELTRALIRLESSVDKNSFITGEQIKAIREQGDALEKKFNERLAGMNLVSPPAQLPRWAGFVGLVFLGLIAIFLLVLVIYITRGGL